MRALRAEFFVVRQSVTLCNPNICMTLCIGLGGLTENAGRENDGPKMTTERKMAGEKSTVSTEITLQ